MIHALTGDRALRIAVVLAAGATLGAGLPMSVAEGAQDVDALGVELARAETRAGRLRIVAELGRSGDPAALAHLLVAAGDEELAVRKRATAALASVLSASGDPRPAALLVEKALSVDLSPTGQLEVLGMLDNLSPPADAARGILRFLDRGDLAKHVARQYVQTLAKPRYAGIDGVRDGLMEQVEHGETSVAAAAAGALGRVRISEGGKPEVVKLLVNQLGMGNDEAEVREAARKSLSLVTGEGDKNTGDWRAWAIKKGYGDPVARVPEKELAAERPPVVFAPVDEGESPAVPSLIYAAIGAVAIAAVGLLLILRRVFTKRAADAIESRRRKGRRGR